MLKNIKSALPSFNRYHYKKLESKPSEIKQLPIATKVQRIDNCVYIQGVNVYWKVKIIHTNNVGYLSIDAGGLSSEHRYCLWALMLRIVTLICSYSMIWAIIMDILLVTQVYFQHDTNFFITAIVFIVVPLSLIF